MEIILRETVPAGLTVIETMRQEADGRVPLWPLYLARLRRDCRAVGFPLDEAGAARIALARRPGEGALCLLDGPPILSRSPELFFAVDAEGAIETRPMKGTAPRGA
ncbi:MAG: hypothetical protein ACK5IP_23040, partial [Paracoccus sp. (in: a-proteobacteria)]